MAVVNKLAKNMPDRSAAKPKKSPAYQLRGVFRTSCFVVEVASGDSATSTFEAARIPSGARLDRRSTLRTAGVAGLTDVDFGTPDAVAALVDGANLAGAANLSANSAILDAALDQPLWQALGMAKDPKEEIALYLTINTGATAAGTVTVDLIFIED